MKNFLNRSSSLLISLITIVSFVFTACEGDDNPNNSNPNLRTSNPTFSLNLSDLINAPLLEIQGGLFVPPNIAQNSIQGVYVRNVGNRYMAFELAEPNNRPGGCTLPELENGFLLVYTCGDTVTKYNAITGLPDKENEELEYPLKSFPTAVRDNILFIN